MVSINSEISNLIERRMAECGNLFYTNVEPVRDSYGHTVTKRGEMFGLQTDGQDVLSTVFDRVEIISDMFASLSIGGLSAAFHIPSRSYISDFKYAKIFHDGNFLILSWENGLNDLFSIVQNKILLEGSLYDEYNLKCDNTEYLWAKRGKSFDFIHRQTGRVIQLADMRMAYDTEFGMVAQNKYGVVSCYDENGTEHYKWLRELVCKA
ncbi:MAG: hypothetical protein LUC91_00615, partial [Prevotella sp.]|nr:hypothetical protein [Prevotella sp.]